jgi:hypothetical protein
MSGNAYTPAVIQSLVARVGSGYRPSPMQLGLDFLSSTASLSLDFLSAGLARASMRTQFLPIGFSLALSFAATSTAPPNPALTMNFAAGAHVPNRNPSLAANFVAPVQGSPPSLKTDFVAQAYAAGMPDAGVYLAGTPAADEGAYAAGAPDPGPPGLYLQGSSQGQYQAGFQSPGAYQDGTPANGIYTIENYALPLAVELNLNFLAYQAPGDPLAYAGLNLALDFLDGGPYIARGVLNFSTLTTSFLGQSYAAGAPTPPPSGTILLPDPPLSIGFVTPVTDTDARLSYAVLGDTLI